MPIRPIGVTCLVLTLGAACNGTGKGGSNGFLAPGSIGGAPGPVGGAPGPVGDTPAGPNACGNQSVSLTKRVQLSVGSVPPDLDVGPAWISHSSEDYVSYLYGAIKATNIGTVGHCFVRANSISYRDQAGQEIENNSFTYVYGRVKALSASSTWTCLDPGESAYFNIIEPLSYFDVTSIYVKSFQYDEGGKPPLADLETTGYTGTGSSLSIVVNNRGTGSAKNASLVVYALGASGDFEHWTFADFANRDLWSPGETRTAKAWLSYDAPCPELLVVPYYEAAEKSSSLSPDKKLLAAAESTTAADALAASLLRRHDQEEDAKLALLRP